MKTADYPLPKLKQRRTRDYVFILEDWELVFTVNQIDWLTEQWNNGMALEEIAKIQGRFPEEILLALIDQSIKGKIERPFAFRGERSGANKCL